MRRPATILIVLGQIAVLVIFFLLIRKNLQLQRLVKARVELARSGTRFYAGDRLQSLSLRDMTDRNVVLDVQQGQTLLVVIHPGCGSCSAAIDEVSSVEGASVVSLAPLAETRRMAQTKGLRSAYVARQESMPPAVARKLTHYPQIVVIEQGTIIRTCNTVAHCR